uniref:Uncharacterized protein n=1 Tax=Chryseobacterium endophyticum TaxID=1854762 RepID=A0AAU6WU79_9FLAO
MQKYFLMFIVLFGVLGTKAQQKTFCNPINIDYGYTPFEVFSKQENTGQRPIR